MAKISTYPSATNVTGTDKVIGTDSTTSAVKNYTVDELADYAIAKDQLSSIGLELSWSNRDPEYKVESTHIDGLTYSKLGVNFTNIVIDPNSVYKLIIERKRSAGIRRPLNYRKGGYKRASTLNPPIGIYSGRLSEIAFTYLENNKFDFKWDLFFQPINTANTKSGWPRPSGLANSKIIKWSDIHFALRVSITKAGVTEVSNVLREVTLRAMADANADTLSYILK
mgnify:FL=1|tara:strand:+ start:56 stop:730 length:675 start_codon:yes stop_codon:yes gene_type:complete